AVNSALPTAVATDSTVANAATDRAVTQSTSSRPASTPIASAPAPAISTATELCKKVVMPRSAAPVQKALLQIMAYPYSASATAHGYSPEHHRQCPEASAVDGP